MQSEESAAQKTDAALRARLAASQQQDATDVKAKDAQLASWKKNADNLQDMLKEHDDEAKKEDTKLQSSLAAATAQLQREKQDAASQEQQLKEQLDSEQSTLQTTETHLRGQLMDQKTKDAVLLRGAKAQLEKSEASRQSMIFSHACALVAVLLVAAFAFRVAQKKHRALGEALRLQQPLLQVNGVPGKVGDEDVDSSNIADSAVPRNSSLTFFKRESPLAFFKRRSPFVRAVGRKNLHNSPPFLPPTRQSSSLARRPTLVADKAGDASFGGKDVTDQVIGA
jgi:hypothetical protein